MTEKRNHKKKARELNWLVPGIIGLVFLLGIAFMARLVMTDSGPRKKEIATITLLKPPPPEVKEKPPEPEVPKEVPKENMVAPDTPQTPQDQPQDQSQDNTPAGSDLGVDGEGVAGSDGFGLVGKKGGKSITLGGGGMNRMNLRAKFGRYTQKVQDEIRAQVNKQLARQGGIPKGKYITLVHITLNSKGGVAAFRINSSSGQAKIDQAVKEALASIMISEVPPEGMPSGMTIRIASQG